LERQIPVLKKKFFYAEDFAKASLNEIFSEQKLKNASVFEANYFSNAVLINDGNMHFHLQALPWEAQLTSYRDAIALENQGDDPPNIFLVGNYYDNNIQMGRYDADYGSILVNHGHAQFSCEGLNGLAIPGQSRHVRLLPFKANKFINSFTSRYIVARNDDSVRVVEFRKSKLAKKK